LLATKWSPTLNRHSQAPSWAETDLARASTQRRVRRMRADRRGMFGMTSYFLLGQRRRSPATKATVA
jgi:hypothetical protein